MKSLKTLIQLQKTFVDEQRIHLAKLQARLDDIINAIAELEISKAREQVVAGQDAESRQTYGAYVKASIKKARDLEHDRQIAEAAVESARDKLSELFEEQKRYEIAEETRLADEGAKLKHLETVELDEIGSITHERKKK